MPLLLQLSRRKRKKYDTPFGTFTYQDIPSKVYSYGVDMIQEGNYFYKIATAEKALCDQLYKTKIVKNYAELKELLFEDMRIDENELRKISLENVLFLAEKYGSTNVKKMSGLLRKMLLKK